MLSVQLIVSVTLSGGWSKASCWVD